MLNIEDFKEEMIKKDGGAFGVEAVTHKVLECVGYDCDRCLFHGDCQRKRWDWLLAEKKDVIVITKLEYDILKFALRNDYCYITRTESGHVEVHKEKPLMRSNEIFGDHWENRGKSIYLFDDLFHFIKWVGSEKNEPMLIKGILDECEVLENDI